MKKQITGNAEYLIEGLAGKGGSLTIGITKAATVLIEASLDGSDYIPFLGNDFETAVTLKAAGWVLCRPFVTGMTLKLTVSDFTETFDAIFV